MEKERGTARERELADILSQYGDILNAHGAESREELAYLKKYANDPEAIRLLRGGRAVKALYEAFGSFPDLGTEKSRGPKRKSKSKSS